MSCRVLWTRDLMKQDDDRTSAVPGIQNVSDIGARRWSKPRLDELMCYCNMWFLNGDSFIPLKQTTHVGARNLKALKGLKHFIFFLNGSSKCSCLAPWARQLAVFRLKICKMSPIPISWHWLLVWWWLSYPSLLGGISFSAREAVAWLASLVKQLRMWQMRCFKTSHDQWWRWWLRFRMPWSEEA